jgi:hypothetical protein
MTFDESNTEQQDIDPLLDHRSFTDCGVVKPTRDQVRRNSSVTPIEKNG